MLCFCFLRQCSNPHLYVCHWDTLPLLSKPVFLDVCKSAPQDHSRQKLGFQTLGAEEKGFLFFLLLTKVDLIVCKPHHWNAVNKQTFKRPINSLSQFVYLALSQMTSV